MATDTQQGTNGMPTAAFEFPSVEEASQRIHDLNERLIESSKSAGLAALDTFEKAMQTVEDFEQKIAAASPFDFVSEAAAKHRKVISDLTASYTSAARELLK